MGMGGPGMLRSFPAAAPYIGLGSPLLPNPFAQVVWVGPLPAWSNLEEPTTLPVPALVGAIAIRRGQPRDQRRTRISKMCCTTRWRVL